jgi:beta-phosphoglucomutase
MPSRCLAFDLDGVLVDMDFPHFDALNTALRCVTQKACITEAEHRTTFKGLPTRVKLERLVAEKRLPAHSVEFVKRRKQEETLLRIAQLKPDPTKLELLATLSEQGWRLAVCSNAVRESVRAMLAYTDLIEYLAFFLSNEDAPPKPDPRMYLKAASLFGIPPAQLVVVEDSEPGKLSALQAGCILVPVQTPHEVTPELLSRIYSAIAAKETVAC